MRRDHEVNVAIWLMGQSKLSLFKGGVQKVRSAVERRLVTNWLFSGDQKVRLTELK